MKQTFVQLTFPIPKSAPDFGTVYVRTYWREYDRKNGIVKGIIPGSLNEAAAKTIPYLTTRQSSVNLNLESVEDLGGGQVLVGLKGSYLNGTAIRVGSTVLTTGSSGFLLLPDRLQFTASSYDLATKRTTLMSRGGIETNLVLDKEDQFNFRIGNRIAPGYPKLATVDDTNSVLMVGFTGNLPHLRDGTPYVIFVIGNKVFGFSDAPITWRQTPDSITEGSVLVPTSLLLASKQVEIKSLLARSGTELTLPLFGISPASKAETLVLIEQGTDYARFLLNGNRLRDLSVVAPPDGVTITRVGSPADPDTQQFVRIPATVFKTYKQLVLQRAGDRPFILPLPAIDFKAANDKPAAKDVSTFTVSVPGIVLKVDGTKPAANATPGPATPDCKVAADGTHTPAGCIPKPAATPTTPAQP